MVRIMPYKLASRSAKALVNAIGLGAKLKNNVRPPVSRSVIINWGCKEVLFNTTRHTIINPPVNVSIAANKLLTLQKLKEKNVPCCDFTTDKAQVKRWLVEGHRVLVRHLLNSHSGRGTVVLEGSEATIPNAPLYTKYHKKTNEFRVHVFDGKVIDYAEKKARSDRNLATYNSLIRSYDNGWVYCRDDILVLDSVKSVALKAVQALGLDFGAVDIILHKDRPLCLEINTAPGLEGRTLESYKNAILELNTDGI